MGSQAVENASSIGMLVVAAAGNGGNIGYRSVTHNSLNSPGVAPSAIAVGASANSHVVYQTVRVNGSSLGNLRGLLRRRSEDQFAADRAGQGRDDAGQ